MYVLFYMIDVCSLFIFLIYLIVFNFLFLRDILNSTIIITP